MHAAQVDPESLAKEMTKVLPPGAADAGNVPVLLPLVKAIEFATELEGQPTAAGSPALPVVLGAQTVFPHSAQHDQGFFPARQSGRQPTQRRQKDAFQPAQFDVRWQQ